MYAEQTIKNSSFLKRFSHEARFQMAVDLLQPSSEDQILDYGTGDGFMLSKIHAANNHCRVVGYEPSPNMFAELQKRISNDSENQGIEIVNNTTGFTRTFNKICCLEVLEHLTEKNQQKEVKEMLRLLTDGGKLIISVPVEVGFSSLLKNIARIFLHQTHGNTTFQNIIYSLFGIPIDRGDEAFISNHIGFYYPDLEKLLLSSGLKIRNRFFSPFLILKGAINSQVFFVLEK